VPDDKTDLVIRSTHNRKLNDSDEKLFEHLSELDIAGTYDLEVKKGQKNVPQELPSLQFDTTVILAGRRLNSSLSCLPVRV